MDSMLLFDAAGSTIPAENCEGGKRAVSDDTASSMQTVPAALASPAAANELHCDDMAIPLSPTPLETPVSPASLGLPLSPDPSVVLSSTSADVQSFDIDSDSVHKSQVCTGTYRHAQYDIVVFVL